MKRTACGIGIICAVLAIAAGGFALSENQKKNAENSEIQNESKVLTGPVDASEEKAYFLKEEDGLVVVYEEDGQTVYEKTGIAVDSLPEDLQEELKAGKRVKNNRELYSFLENFSS